MPTILLEADVRTKNVVVFLLVNLVEVRSIYISAAFTIRLVGSFAVEIIPRILVYLGCWIHLLTFRQIARSQGTFL